VAAAVAPTTPVIAPASVATPAPAPAVPVAKDPGLLSSAAPSFNTETTSSMPSGPVHMPATSPKPASVATQDHVAAHEAKHNLYTVKITDSYKKIAHAHHVTVAELKAANHIHDNVLHVGQKLVIPAEPTGVAKSEAAPQTGTASHVALDESNSTASLSAEPTTATTGHHAHHHLYTVVKGDTLKKIAEKYNTSTAALREANNLHSTKLVAGEKLKIPSKESRSAAVRTPTPFTPALVPVQAQPNQVETQPTPVAPVATPAPNSTPNPQPSPAASPELANLTF
jgi:N-acetylmuramoyl-L-alanine amidase